MESIGYRLKEKNYMILCVASTSLAVAVRNVHTNNKTRFTSLDQTALTKNPLEHQTLSVLCTETLLSQNFFDCTAASAIWITES